MSVTESVFITPSKALAGLVAAGLPGMHEQACWHGTPNAGP